MSKFDFLIIGSGLFGSTVANFLRKKGRSCLVIDKRSHIGGNVYTERINEINVHKYGAHIFHTDSKDIWDYVNSFVDFNSYTNSPIANYKGKLYNLPFNMNTFYQMWGVKTPHEAFNIIMNQRNETGIIAPQNLEEQAISLVGKDIYNTLIKGYTEKQWGRKAVDLPAFIIKRIPMRYTFDNNYFDDRYQGIPIGGYTQIIKKMLYDVEVMLGVDYFSDRSYFDKLANNIIYTGEIDRFYDYCYGNLEYRTVCFNTETLYGVSNYQGNAVVNFTDINTPYTRIIEHKHFEFGCQKDTIISKEYSKEWILGDEPYYPVNDVRNNLLYTKYKELSRKENRIFFGGRLAEYKYYNMDVVINNAISLSLNL
jgi:UDP-galactopyranose mutase